MSLHVLPVVGSSGFYDFVSPFHIHAENNVRYTCRAIRQLSDYLANNEDPEEDIYKTYGIEDDYETHLAENVYIVSLQSTTGHFLYIPHTYINSYPSTDGVPYRSVMLQFSLPSMPVSQTYEDLVSELKDLITARLGVPCASNTIETSLPVQVPEDTHLANQELRNQRKAGESLFIAMDKLQADNDALRLKLTEIETYLKSKL